MPVRRLPESLANQIAAGEVVERPASAVKELVENAIDAGARRIEVELEDGGRRLVRVVDDGCGMAREDALLALERHTTSKLASADDLFDIRTFGFRGEALPSIASVSRFTLTTRRAEDLAATRIAVEGGRIASVEDAGAPAGTRIDIADLFFNVPARLKFLKTRATELGHATDWLVRLGLAHPAVGIAFVADGRVQFKAEPTADLRERLAALLGRELHAAVYPVDGNVGGVRVSGWAAGPQRQNSTAREIFTFVNRRFVRDRGLLHAVARAYEGVLSIGRSPACVLFIDLPPDRVDVNVHPQKLEVRFAEPRLVYDAVAKSMAFTLSTSPWLARAAPARTYALRPAASDPAASDPAASDPAASDPAASDRAASDRAASDRAASDGAAAASAASDRAASAAVPAPDAGEDGSRSAAAPPLPAGNRKPWQQSISDALHRYAERHLPVVEEHPLVAGDAAAQPPRPAPVAAPPPARAPAPVERLVFADLRYLGQLHRTYLVCESAEGLVLLDQHAAHERVLYERYRAARAGASAPGQPLLVPVTLELSPADARLVEGALEDLADLGFELEPFGGRTFSLKAAPAELAGADLARVVCEIAAEVRATGRGASAQAAEEALLARMACHAAVRAGDPLEPPEARKLLEQLDGTPFGAQCPHGRPVLVRFDDAHLRALFGRTYEGTPRAAALDRVSRG